MNFYLITQEATRNQEYIKEYLWARQFKKDGKKHQPYENLKEMKNGDIIFHNNKESNFIDAISIVIEDGKEYSLLAMPPEDRAIYGEGSKEGYIVKLDTELLEYPIELEKLLNFAYNTDNSRLIDINGKKKVAYSLQMNLSEALYCIEIARSKGNKNHHLWKIDEFFGKEYVDYYTDNDKYIIDKSLNAAQNDTKPRSYFIISPEEAVYNVINSSKKKSPKRDCFIAAKALAYANYECEYDRNHPTFIRKNSGHNYTEPHHLVPISRTGDFTFNKGNDTVAVSLDIPNNIVSLCSHCHNLLHYGRMEEKVHVLRKLYDERVVKLKNAGIDITFDDLLKYYN